MNTKQFLMGKSFAVVGASDDRAKFGNKVLRCYIRNQYHATPVHPAKKEIEGLQTYPSLSAIPEKIDGVSIITPPAVSIRIVEEAIRLGIRNIWLQPGAEDPAVVRVGNKAGINFIYGGPCLLVELG